MSADKPWDWLYPKSAPKPKVTRTVDGWRQLPGGGWAKDQTATNGYSGLVRTDLREGPQRAADISYGER